MRGIAVVAQRIRLPILSDYPPRYVILVYLYQCNSWICQSLAIVLVRASEKSLKVEVRRVTESNSTAHCIVELEGVEGEL